ncbi:hypothetical protein V8G54_018770 [Vigna mungo]|uniref:GRF-type domain-containing protein n=1 Tax=Vigna mungo TaxID=3915 RepID=A0AAQ3RRS5_VIGMU
MLIGRNGGGETKLRCVAIIVEKNASGRAKSEENGGLGIDEMRIGFVHCFQSTVKWLVTNGQIRALNLPKPRGFIKGEGNLHVSVWSAIGAEAKADKGWWFFFEGCWSITFCEIKVGSGGDQVYCRCSPKRMSKERNETPIFHCGQRSVMRTAITMKNRDKHFWGCSKYKNGVEDAGCNFFKWCIDVGSEDSGRYVKSEGKKENLVSSEELESTRKMIVKIQKSVFFLEKSMKGLILWRLVTEAVDSLEPKPLFKAASVLRWMTTCSAFVVAFNSFPSAPHPVISQYEEHLQRLKDCEASSSISSSSLSHKLDGLLDLHDCTDNFLHLTTKQVLA